MFAWLDLGKFLDESTKEAELELFQKLLDDHKVYVVPGSEFRCEQFGWFRVVISVEPHNLDAGITRIKSALLGISSRKGIKAKPEKPKELSVGVFTLNEHLREWDISEGLRGWC